MKSKRKSYYILVTERTTYTKYLIERVGDAPLGDYDGEYLGFVDGETTNHEYSKPFKTTEEALKSDLGYVEG